MNGYSRVYCIGGAGDEGGIRGVHPLLMQILVGTSGHQWLEPRYFDESMGPLGQIRVVIPEQPDHPHALIDACIAFFPDYFRACPLLNAVEQEVRDACELDFRSDRTSIPEHWPYLRKQALPIFRELHIFEGALEILSLDDWMVE